VDPLRYIDDFPENFKDLYLAMHRLCDKEGKSREFLFKLLTKLFPGISKELLEIYDSFTVHNKYQNQRKQAIYRCFLREKLDLKRKTESLMMEHLSEKLLKASRAKEAEGQALLAKKLRLELEEKRKSYDKLQAELEKKQRFKEEQIKRELELQKAKFEKHAQIVKYQAEMFRQAKLESIKQELIEKERLQREQQRALKEQIEKNTPIVMKRQAFAEDNLVQKLEDKKKRQEEEDERRERIRLAIEHYKDRPVVERNEKRMMSETEAVNIRRETKEVKPLFGNPGYYDDSLMNDPRFRLQTRLFEAGLSHNTYGKDLLTKMSRPNQ
jgi:hypothetical protein